MCNSYAGLTFDIRPWTLFAPAPHYST